MSAGKGGEPFLDVELLAISFQCSELAGEKPRVDVMLCFYRVS